MSGKKQRILHNQTISFNNKQVTNDEKMATSFCKQFTTIVSHTSDPAARRVQRQHLCDHHMDNTLSAFTTEQVEKAIKQSSNSVAAGPDGPPGPHIPHQSLQLLTAVGQYSTDLEASHLHPKAGKPCHLGTSYRSISLLCPNLKVLERLLIPALEGSLRLADFQHRFSNMRSTTSAKLRLTQKVAAGFNQNKPPLPTGLMASDISKAFDTVNHTSTTTSSDGCSRICRLELHPADTNITLICHAVQVDVPQGSVILPLLFNFFVSNYPSNCQL